MSYTYFVLKIILAMILGLLIGLERQLTGHPAGVRINVLICMGTCFFTLFPMLNGSEQVYRVSSSIISGVSFLCSGVIFKENGSVKGMNTAATLWCTAAIGVLSSANSWFLAPAATLILIVSNLILRPIAKAISPISLFDDSEKNYQVSITCLEKSEQEIRQLLINTNECETLFLNNLESSDVIGDKVEVIAQFNSSGKQKDHILEAIVIEALKNPNVISGGWEIVQ